MPSLLGIFYFLDIYYMEKLIESFDNFNPLNEKKVKYKRKYTEKYPAKIVYSGAKIRKAVFNAIKDDKISERDLNDILDEFGASYKWKKTNKHLFSLYEDGEERYYTLTQIGKKIKMKLPDMV